MSRRALIVSYIAVVMLALAVVVLRSGGGRSLGRVTEADSGNAELVAVGKQLYATRCAGCHGANLEGQPGWPQRQANGVVPASPLGATGKAWQQTDRWLFRTIKEGGQTTAPPGYLSAMPPFGNSLRDEEIWAVIAYMKSNWSPQMQADQPRE